MIKAIIFDCFGVLTTDGWLPFKKAHFVGSSVLAAQATDLRKRADAGLMSYEDFIVALAELASVSTADAKQALEGNVPNAELFEYVRQELKPHVRIGLLSNAGADWLDELFAPADVGLFDAVSLSYQTGFVKPDPRAYTDIAEKLQVSAEECVFIDDQERYCTAAREAGMKAIVYQEFNSFQTALRDLLKMRS